jgi:hypothetical protein
VQKPEKKRLLPRPRRKWEDDINVDLQEVRWDMEWNNLDQNRNRLRELLNAVMKFRVL